MRTRATIAALFLALCAGGSASAAPLMATDGFVANVRQIVDVLDDTSRIVSGTTDIKVVAFAQDEILAQERVTASLGDWIKANSAGDAASALGPAPSQNADARLVPLASLEGGPLLFAAAEIDDATDGIVLRTGRSVAYDAPTPVMRMPVASVRDFAPPPPAEAAPLRTASGKELVALYKAVQTDALRRLSTLYADYARNGDDEALRSIAHEQLRIVDSRAADLARL